LEGRSLERKDGGWRMLEVGWNLKALGYDQRNLSRAQGKWHSGWGQVSFKRICGRSIVVDGDCASMTTRSVRAELPVWSNANTSLSLNPSTRC